MQRFKVIIVGDAGVGKTSLIETQLTSVFNVKYVPTLGVDVRPSSFNTNHGEIVLDFWDTAGQEQYSKSKEGYYVSSDACVAMYDCHSRRTFENAKQQYYNVCKTLGKEIPIIYIGNKADITEKIKVKEGIIASVKGRYNFNQIFTELLRKLTGKEDLIIIE